VPPGPSRVAAGPIRPGPQARPDGGCLVSSSSRLRGSRRARRRSRTPRSRSAP
jgi:hypothetical protein